LTRVDGSYAKDWWIDLGISWGNLDCQTSKRINETFQATGRSCKTSQSVKITVGPMLWSRVWYRPDFTAEGVAALQEKRGPIYCGGEIGFY